MANNEKVPVTGGLFTNTDAFIVKDYTGKHAGASPTIVTVDPADIFEYVAAAERDKKNVEIYTIGPCVLDWRNKKYENTH